MVLHPQGERAAGAAIGADGIGPGEFPGAGLVFEKLVGEGAHRTDVDALAAELAVERPLKISADPGLESPVDKAEFRHAHHLFAHPGAHPAEHAAVHIPFYEARGGFNRLVELAVQEAVAAHFIFIDQVLQLALAPLVAHRAIQGMVHQQQFKQGFAGASHRGGVGVYHHAVGGRRGAGRNQPALHLLDLDHAHAARPEGHQLLVIAKGGDMNPGGLGGLQDSGAVRYLYFPIVYGQANHGTPSTSQIFHMRLLCR
ncbi:MAG: hypothetical protein BWY77_01343 [bacterium ADurb.Bin431]|nr:MAG: hypothetical protein BWY77_01343 [bacterium ADurb.Bin431]